MAALNDFEVEGINYSPSAIQRTIDELIGIRNEALKNLGDGGKGSHYAIFFSHVIAYLNDYKDAVEKK